MEEFTALLVENAPEIMSYVLSALAYFLLFLYRQRFGKTRDSMQVLFNDKVTQVNKVDKNLRADIEKERALMREELNNAIAEYNKSKADYEVCIAELSKMNKALNEIIAEQEEINYAADFE